MAIPKTPKMILQEIGALNGFKTPEDIGQLICWVEDLARWLDITTGQKRKPKGSSQSGIHTRDFIAAYAEAYEARYGISPKIIGKEVGTAQRIVKDLGVSEAIRLVKAYLQIGSDPWICAKKHNLMTFESNINAVQLFAKSKSYTTFQELQQREKKLLKRETHY